MNIRSFAPGEGIAWVARGGAVRLLIVTNIAVFVLMQLLPRAPVTLYFGLVPPWTFQRLMLWQLVTYLFIHAGVLHLVFNMLMLWMFGTVLERAWGTRRFVEFYFFCGMAAGLCSAVLGIRDFIPIVGASGAIYGLLAAFAILFPEQIILLFFMFPMKMRHAVWVLAGINLLGALSAPSSSVAYIAHLAGAGFGYLYLQYGGLRRFLSRWSPAEIRAAGRERNAIRQAARQREVDQEVDRILDKISRQGMASLTRQEKAILHKKSQRG